MQKCNSGIHACSGYGAKAVAAGSMGRIRLRNHGTGITLPTTPICHWRPSPTLTASCPGSTGGRFNRSSSDSYRRCFLFFDL